MTNNKKITFAIHENLQKELREDIIRRNYGLRGKSRWVSEAVALLLKMKNYPDLVNLSNEMRMFEKTETIIIDSVLKNKLDDAVIVIRKIFPTLEGVQSRIIRTAIIQRLLQSDINLSNLS